MRLNPLPLVEVTRKSKIWAKLALNRSSFVAKVEVSIWAARGLEPHSIVGGVVRPSSPLQSHQRFAVQAVETRPTPAR